MLFKVKRDGKEIDVLFKDKESINHRNSKDYLENIKMLAHGIREYESNHDKVHNILFDQSFISEKTHHSTRNGCEGFGIKDMSTKLTEKRMCKCMNYYNEESSICKACKLERKWRNGKGDKEKGIEVKDYESPSEIVIDTVGGIDLVLVDKNNKDKEYITEIKPEGSKETLVRMMAEIYTMVIANNSNNPAICFFKGSIQHKDFCNPEISENQDFKYILTKIKVFYITTEQKADIVLYKIHDNSKEALI